MGRQFSFGVSVVLLGILLPAAAARAVIRRDTTTEKTYAESKAVVVGTITKVVPDTWLVEVKATETVKGDPFPDTFRIQVKNPPELIKSAAAGQPVVVFLTGAPGSEIKVHIADTWLTAVVRPNMNPPLWLVRSGDKNGPLAFPGRTEALVKIVAEHKAGTPSTLLNAVDAKVLHGGAKEAAKLPVAKPTFLLAADVNGDKKPDLLVGTADGVKLFLATAGGYDDATAAWGLSAAKGAKAAAADVNRDGKVDLLIGKTVWLNDGQKFTASKAPLDVPDAPAVVAEGLIDVNGDAKPDAVVVLADGQLLTFANLGLPDQPWAKGPARKAVEAGTPLAAVFGDFGDNGKPHALVVTDAAVVRVPLDPAAGSAGDFERLTGEKLSSQPGFDAPTKAASAGVMDVNGDGRADVVVVGDGGNVVLVNRGFGTFLIDPDAGRPLLGPDGKAGDKALAFKVTPTSAWAGADVKGDGTDEVLVLADDGRLFVVDNPPK